MISILNVFGNKYRLSFIDLTGTKALGTHYQRRGPVHVARVVSNGIEEPEPIHFLSLIHIFEH